MHWTRTLAQVGIIVTLVVARSRDVGPPALAVVGATIVLLLRGHGHGSCPFRQLKGGLSTAGRLVRRRNADQLLHLTQPRATDLVFC